MAYSPRGVEPLLDYEAEEERILRALERPIREGRAQVEVVEYGTLADLEEQLRAAPADIVHLTGHGRLTPAGPRLMMEDELGRPDPISADQLLQVLKRATKKPDLVVISSCHSAEDREGIPSFATTLVNGGITAVLGWDRPVRDDVATRAAADLYGRLCGGESLSHAVAFVRAQLHDAERNSPLPSQSWSSLHLLTRNARGFRVDVDRATPLPRPPIKRDALYRHLKVIGGMRVLERGFVGRRRQLQRLLRMLRSEHDESESPIAGAVILGMKGVGKSCLVGRTLDRHSHHEKNSRVIVLHGLLDDVKVLKRFAHAAREREDRHAEIILQVEEPALLRIDRLLSAHWADEPIVIVLDDFEQNLELSDGGNAQMNANAAALLEVLLPVCHANRPKLLVTTTASFSVPPKHHRALLEVPLGSFAPTVVRKLWTRLPDEGRAKLSPSMWCEMADRLGRNARVLDWAMALLRGKTPEQVEEMARKVGEEIPRWDDVTRPNEERITELARLFLRTLAMDEARAHLSEDALTFVKRARVYEWPVPKAGFEGLIDELSIDLDRDVTVLQNLGILEVDEWNGQRVHRVSPLVEPAFEVADAARWHTVAAEFWEQASKNEQTGDQAHRTTMAWDHALQGKCLDVAERCGRIIGLMFHGLGLPRFSQELSERHLKAFPDSAEGLLWAGLAAEQMGDIHGGWALYERGEKIASTRCIEKNDRLRIVSESAIILCRLGRFDEAERRLIATLEAAQATENQHLLAATLNSLGMVQHNLYQLDEAKFSYLKSLDIARHIYKTEAHPMFAAPLNGLASVLESQGDLKEAQATLERSLRIWTSIYGTKAHPNIAISQHELGRVIAAQGHLKTARTHFEHSLVINSTIYGDSDNPQFASTLHELGRLHIEQGDCNVAKKHLEHALAMKLRSYGTEEHPSIASSLRELGRAQLKMRNLKAARSHFKRSLLIERSVHKERAHPDIASCLRGLAEVLEADGDLGGARSNFEIALTVTSALHRSDGHPNIAALLDDLARVCWLEDDFPSARAHLERAIDAWAMVHGTNEHACIATDLYALANVLQSHDEFTGARACLERAIAIWTTVHGTEQNLDGAAALHALAKVLQEQGDFTNARTHLEHALAIRTKQHDTEPHPDIATSLGELAELCCADGDLAEARAYLERSVDTWIRVHGTEEHLDVATALRALAGVLSAQGDLTSASAHLERSRAISIKVHGSQEHPSVAASLYALAAILHLRGDLTSARAHLERCLDILAKVYGTDERPEVVTSLRALACVLEAEGKPDEAVATYRRVLKIEEAALGNLDNWHSAEAEVSLGLLLLTMGRSDEAHQPLSHAYEVLQTQAPNHPALAFLHQFFDNALSIDPSQLVEIALQARHDGRPPPEFFSEAMAALPRVAPSCAEVAILLQDVALGRPLPTETPALPDEVYDFATQVLNAARAIDSTTGSQSS